MTRVAFMEVLFDSDKEFPDFDDIADNVVEVIDISVEDID